MVIITTSTARLICCFVRVRVFTPLPHVRLQEPQEDQLETLQLTAEHPPPPPQAFEEEKTITIAPSDSNQEGQCTIIVGGC